ncbi:PH domain leucine-rich repeat-containing protein phosphatase 1-like [Ostrinia furnacalis]|uniref:PH domain leucine-rich repeat-containing protein phosphatase 1-like n=1 Tax=Ostrinia furnacalis TaxID=93504 RepID=UPI00103B8BCB|nr:PH domain leucine-rich repeat-containing protein phosphatase 1-like [Ostrinia furnacalis]
MVCDDGLHASSPHARRKSLRRLSSTRGFKPRNPNEYGWIRVFDGLQPFAVDAPSKLVKVSLNTTVEEVNKKLGLGEELTLWLQIGGEKSRRLEQDEYPLRIQEHFLVTYGWSSEARRQRLAVDPELRHSLQWCAGPADRSGGVLRSGTIHILKGHVFPQWKPRPAHVIGSRLHSYGSSWEMLELSGGSIELCPPKAQKLVLCVKPRCLGNNTLGDAALNHIFLGFNAAWERNMWFCWLKEATQSSQPPNVLDLSGGGGRATLGAALAQHAAGDFAIRVLSMRTNALSSLPPQLWSMHALTHLDISDNRITDLPEEICQLTHGVGGRATLGAALAQHAAGDFAIMVLSMRTNALSSLPSQLWSMHALMHLDISDNRITDLPEEICQLTQGHGGRATLSAALAQHAAGDFAIRVLSMRTNALSSLPPQVWSMHTLTHLDISDNRITDLPEEICQLTQ